MKKKASASWEGGIKDGKGHISTESGALDNQPFGFNTRFGDTRGTNPEELIGAAHAGCFAMALSNELGQVNITAKKIEAKAEVHLDKKDGGFAITRSDISVNVDAGDADESAFNKAVEAAKAHCPVSNVLNAEIAVTVTRA